MNDAIESAHDVAKLNSQELLELFFVTSELGLRTTQNKVLKEAENRKLGWTTTAPHFWYDCEL